MATIGRLLKSQVRVRPLALTFSESYDSYRGLVVLRPSHSDHVDICICTLEQNMLEGALTMLTSAVDVYEHIPGIDPTNPSAQPESQDVTPVAAAVQVRTIIVTKLLV